MKKKMIETYNKEFSMWEKNLFVWIMCKIFNKNYFSLGMWEFKVAMIYEKMIENCYGGLYERDTY